MSSQALLTRLHLYKQAWMMRVSVNYYIRIPSHSYFRTLEWTHVDAWLPPHDQLCHDLA
jgi:hypothetical protein